MTVATEAGVTIALDTVITDKLKEEGLAREFVSRIQNERRERSLEVSDRIKVTFKTDDELCSAIMNFSDYISNETLTVELAPTDSACELTADINGKECQISIVKNK